MIPANKGRWFNAWFAGHARGRIHGTFGRVIVRGLGAVRSAAAERPILAVSNHTSWWDPLVILHASTHLLGTDGHAMMDAKNLRRLPFFGRVGAFGVDLTDPGDGARAMKYAAKLLDRAGKLVWIFPQGAERPLAERPLGFRPGAAHVARVAKRAAVFPAAIAYVFAAEERPRLYVSFGPEIEGDRRDAGESVGRMERAVMTELDAIAEAERAPEATADAGWETIHKRDPPWISGLAERWLAWITRPGGGALPPRR